MEGATPAFRRWCGTGERSPAHAVAHGKHSPRGGRSLHSDPLREGQCTPVPLGGAASPPGDRPVSVSYTEDPQHVRVSCRIWRSGCG